VIPVALQALLLPLLSLPLLDALAGAATAPSRRMPDGKEWTSENLSIDADPSYCHGDARPNCSRYGRLYTWDSAERGCRSLGAGWRLPTDAEWRQLARHYGGVGHFGEGGLALHRQSEGEKQRAFSVRCVRP